MKGKRILSVAMAVILAGTSVSGVSETTMAKKSPVTVVTVSKKVSLTAGKKGLIEVTHAKKVKIQKKKFKSLNVKVVKVNEKGVLTGVSAGSTTVKTTVIYKFKKKKAKRKFTTKVTVTKGGVKLPVTDNDTATVPYPSNAPVESVAPEKTPAATESVAPEKTPAATESAAPEKTPAATESVVPEKTPAATEEPQETKNPLEEPPLVSAEPTQCPDGQHQMETVEMKEPTCATKKDGQPLTEDKRRGYILRRCAVCHYEMKTVLAPAQHKFKEVITEATCKLPARVHRICEVCGEEEGSGTNVAGSTALGHYYAWQITKAATCTHAGIEANKCIRCDDVQKDTATGQTEKEIPKTGHKVLHEVCAYCHGRFHSFDLDENGYELIDDREWVVTGAAITTGGSVTTGGAFAIPENQEATCTEDGCEYRLCKDCGRLECLVIKAHGHTPAAEPNVTEATCTASGTSITVCSSCKRVIKVEEIPPTGHSYIWKTTKEATCKEPGSARYECKNCQNVAEDPVEKKSEKVLSALGHTTEGGEWKTTKEPACTEPGLKEYKCGRCNHYFTAEDNVADDFKPQKIAVKGHDWIDGKTVPATCENEGYVPQTCTRCGATQHKEGSEQTALGHKWLSTKKTDVYGNGKVVNMAYDSDCQNHAEYYRWCENCGIMSKDLSAAKQKDLFTDKGESLTWVDTEGELKPHSGDDKRIHVNGKCVKVCTNTLRNNEKCGQSYDVQSIYGYGEWVTTTAPTCTKTGLKEYKCKWCGTMLKNEEGVPMEYRPQTIEALGHNWLDGAAVAATCENEGYVPQTCIRCGETQHKKGSEQTALGHKWLSTKKTDAYEKVVNMAHDRDCQNYAEYYRWCENCGIMSKDLSAAKQKDLFTDKGESLTWVDTEGELKPHSGAYIQSHDSSGYCKRKCENKLWNGTTCGKEFIDGVHKVRVIMAGKKDCHAKCGYCGAVLSSVHCFNQSNNYVTSNDIVSQSKYTEKVVLCTISIPDMAGKSVHLEKMSFEQVESGSISIVGVYENPDHDLDNNENLIGRTCNVADSTQAKRLEDIYIDIPKSGKIYVITAAYKVRLKEFTLSNVKCTCGYKNLSVTIKPGIQ